MNKSFRRPKKRGLFQKKKEQPTFAFKGYKWVIRDGKARRVMVYIIENMAFINPVRGRRAEMVNAKATFDSEAAAVRSKGVQRGFGVYSGNIFSVSYELDPIRGIGVVYDRTGRRVYPDSIHKTRKLALKAVIKDNASRLKRVKAAYQEALRKTERAHRQLARLS